MRVVSELLLLLLLVGLSGAQVVPSSNPGNLPVYTGVSVVTNFTPTLDEIHSSAFPSTDDLGAIVAACPSTTIACHIVLDPGPPITVSNAGSTVIIGSASQTVDLEDNGVTLTCTGTTNIDCIQVAQWGKMHCNVNKGTSSGIGCLITTQSNPMNPIVLRSMVANADTSGQQSDIMVDGFSFSPAAGAVISRGELVVDAVEGKGEIKNNSFLGLQSTVDIDIEDGSNTAQEADINNILFSNNAAYCSSNVGCIPINIISGTGIGEGSGYTFINQNLGDGLLSDGTIIGLCSSGYGCFVNIDGSAASASGTATVVHNSTTVTLNAGTGYDPCPTSGTPWNGKLININGNIGTISTCAFGGATLVLSGSGYAGASSSTAWWTLTGLGNTAMMSNHFLQNIHFVNEAYMEGQGPTIAGTGTLSANGTTTVTSVSGTGFPTSGTANQPIIINSLVYTINTSNCTATTCVLTTSVPTGAAYNYSIGQQANEHYVEIKNAKNVSMPGLIFNVGAEVNYCVRLSGTASTTLGNILLGGRDFSGPHCVSKIQNQVSGFPPTAPAPATLGLDFYYFYPGVQSAGYVIDGFIHTNHTQRLTATPIPITALSPGTTVFTWGALPINSIFSFYCSILYSQTAANTVGIAVQGATNAPTRLDAWGKIDSTNPGNPGSGNYTGAAGSAQNITGITAMPVVSTNPGTAGTVYQAQLNGTIQVGALASTLNVNVFTGSASDGVTIYAGSYCELTP
jgi:hypothetical protein